jgi:glutamate dehydrogenase/leucine dehydrogenase
VGSANNQLSDDGVAGELRDLGIGYVPDFVANAGGLICVSQELDGWDPGRAGAAADRIGDVVRELIAAADAGGGTLLEAAHRRAAERLAPAAAR